MSGHITALLGSCARTRVLRAHGFSQDCLEQVFRSTVLAKLYASPAWSGFCSAAVQTEQLSQQMQKTILLQTNRFRHHQTV